MPLHYVFYLSEKLRGNVSVMVLYSQVYVVMLIFRKSLAVLINYMFLIV